MQKIIYYSKRRIASYPFSYFDGFRMIYVLSDIIFIKDQHKHSKLRIIGQVKESLKNASHVFKILFCGKYLNGRTYIY